LGDPHSFASAGAGPGGRSFPLAQLLGDLPLHLAEQRVRRIAAPLVLLCVISGTSPNLPRRGFFAATIVGPAMTAGWAFRRGGRFGR